MKSRINSITLYICLLLIIWLSIPASLNIKYSLIYGAVQLRLNILLTMGTLPVLIYILIKGNPKFNVGDALYLAYVGIGFFVSVYNILVNDKNLALFLESMTLVLVPFFVFKLSEIISEEDLDVVVNTFLCLCLCIAIQVFVFGFVFNIVSWGEGTSDRAFTTVGNPTTGALFLFVGFAVMLAKFKYHKSKFFLIGSVVLFFAIMQLLTRSAILLTIIYTMIYFYRSEIRLYKKILLVVCIVCALFCCFDYGLLDKIFERFFTDNSYESNEMRVVLAQQGIRQFFSSPFLGTGFGISLGSISTIDLHSYTLNPHNQFIAMLIESGVIGVVVFLMFLFVYTIRSKKSLFTTLVFLVFFVGSLFEVTFTKDIRVVMIFWMPMLCMANAERYLRYLSNKNKRG